jgi:hypothetical protein
LGLKYFSDALKINKGLKTLFLEKNSYDGIGIVYLSKCFSINNSLNNLEISLRNKIVTSEQYKEFFENLILNKSLNKLDLIGIKIIK